MKFNCQIDVDRPVDAVVRHFQNYDNLKQWHPDLVSVEHLTETTGEVGARTKMTYKSFVIIETLDVVDPPREISGTYETTGICTNTMKNCFTALDETSTRYDVAIEYQFHDWKAKTMSIVMPWVFKKQVNHYLKLFKDAAERDGAPQL